jgi:hypothetical protein
MQNARRKAQGARRMAQGRKAQGAWGKAQGAKAQGTLFKAWSVNRKAGSQQGNKAERQRWAIVVFARYR